MTRNRLSVKRNQPRCCITGIPVYDLLLGIIGVPRYKRCYAEWQRFLSSNELEGLADRVLEFIVRDEEVAKMTGGIMG